MLMWPDSMREDHPTKVKKQNYADDTCSGGEKQRSTEVATPRDTNLFKKISFISMNY